MVNYRRNKIKGGSYFFTITLRNRKSTILVERINLLRYALRRMKSKYPFDMEAIVVLPDHLHTISKLPQEDADFAKRIKLFKSIFTQQLIVKGVQLTKNKRGEYSLWQSRFWEHTLRDELDFENHVNYIHYNPVKHGLVNSVGKWPYSSFHRYVKNGILKPHWGSSDLTTKGTYGE